MSASPRPLETDQSDTGAQIAAWARLRRLMGRLMLAILALVALAGAAIWRHRGMASVRFAIGAAVVMGLVMVLGAGLMGLACLRRSRSNGAEAE